MQTFRLGFGIYKAMTLAAVLGIVVAFTPANGAARPIVLVFQEAAKPTAQGPSPSQDSPPPHTQSAPEQTPPASPDAVTPPDQPPAKPAVDVPPSKPATSLHKPKASAAKSRKPRKRAVKPAADPNEPKKIVVSNGSTAEPSIQISSGQPDAQDVTSTNSLLEATGSNLKKISGRQLSPAQQDMVKQIRSYMDQAKSASGLGDTQGAHNLAFKAHLLSEELLKQ